jgi:hypothetical protein|tara:strand:- start:10948 stop:11163 length:216 start_codon:yes stop_codon:yes gene_type:complete
MNNIKLFLVRNYGSLEKAAYQLEVTGATVRSWCSLRPRNMLKHIPEISDQTGANYAEIVEEVLICEEEGAL